MYIKTFLKKGKILRILKHFKDAKNIQISFERNVFPECARKEGRIVFHRDENLLICFHSLHFCLNCFC